MIRRVRLIISGRVQGVGFRASATVAAVRIGVVGWVANRTDGRVQIDAQGTQEQIAEFLAWCRTGPRWARVDSVDSEDVAPGDDAQVFTIRHGSIQD
jgi:acylphosphatase